MNLVLVTGATGFVGRHLCEMLSARGYRVRAALRKNQSMPAHIAEQVAVGEFGARTDWTEALCGVEGVIHCAARAHVIGDQQSERERYMESNARATERLAQSCADRGVGRFVYLSSVKVNGERTAGSPFSPLDVPHPSDAYAISKWLGENRLAEIARESSMSSAIVRSPLVYGPGVRANFLRLMRRVDSHVPLPLGCIKNSRSLVSVWNLCDLMVRLVSESRPVHAIFMVSDGEDLSTPNLIRRLGAALGRRPNLWPVPAAFLRAIGLVTGRQAEIERLCGSLEVDITLTRSKLGWMPPVSLDESLKRTAEWYLSRNEES